MYRSTFVLALFFLVVRMADLRIEGKSKTMELRTGGYGWFAIKWYSQNYNRLRYLVQCSDPCEVWYGLCECIDSGGFHLGATRCTSSMATGVLEYESTPPLHEKKRRATSGMGLGTDHKKVKYNAVAGDGLYGGYYKRCVGARALRWNITVDIKINYVVFAEKPLYVIVGILGVVIGIVIMCAIVWVVCKVYFYIFRHIIREPRDNDDRDQPSDWLDECRICTNVAPIEDQLKPL